jgi:hypothetical protein
MTNVIRLLVVAVLLMAAPGHAQDCKKGTVCRTLIDNGHKHCKDSAKARWRAIRAVCKAAKAAHNPAACLQAIKDGFNQAVPSVAKNLTGGQAAVLCEDEQTECGDGCCPGDFPVCEPSGVCCPGDYPIDCTTVCCPSDFPFCGSGGACQEAPTTTTIPPSTTTTIPGPTSCTLPPPPPPPDDACRSHLDHCHMTGCGLYPVGGCEARCSGGGFACVGSVGTYTHCTTDADCPPPDAGFETFTVCIPSYYENDDVTFSCAQANGRCAQPCP